MKRRRKPRDEEKERAEQSYLHKTWRAWHADQLKEALAGPDGVAIAAVMAMLNNLKAIPASILVDRVRQIDWRPVSYASRLTVLHQVNEAIAHRREKQGLAPIDDPLPGQDDNAFRLIKAALFP